MGPFSRRKQARLRGEAIGNLIAASYVACIRSLHLCSGLTERGRNGGLTAEERGAALVSARMAASVQMKAHYLMSDGIINADDWDRERDGGFHPGVLAALAQLGYALTALASNDPTPEQLLTSDELASLLHRYGAEEWLERMHERYPELRSKVLSW